MVRKSKRVVRDPSLTIARSDIYGALRDGTLTIVDSPIAGIDWPAVMTEDGSWVYFDPLARGMTAERYLSVHPLDDAADEIAATLRDIAPPEDTATFDCTWYDFKRAVGVRRDPREVPDMEDACQMRLF